jgi:hypothetical protein
MVKESKDNDLLEEMLRWFSAQFMGEDEEVADAALELSEHALIGVRWPKAYQVE